MINHEEEETAWLVLLTFLPWSDSQDNQGLLTYHAHQLAGLNPAPRRSLLVCMSYNLTFVELSLSWLMLV